MLLSTRIYFLALVVMVGWGLPGNLLANTAAACFKCHERTAYQAKVIHPPVAEGRCSVCHNPHVARYQGLLQQDGAALCYTCHQEEAAIFGQGVVHQPIQEGKCLACHDAHASDRQGLLVKTLAENCFSCHTDLPREHTFLHSPFARGRCTICHRPHQAGNSQLLTTANPDQLCSSCHQRPELLSGHSGFPGRVKDCLSCHNPHGSNRQGLVRNILHAPFENGCKDCHTRKGGPVATSVCLGCHPAIQEQLFAAHRHLAVADGNGCTACHSPHAGDRPGLLKGKEAQVCRTCHTMTFQRNEISEFQHRDYQNCSVCHQPHGSDQLAMLRGDGNTVCTQCHETQGQFTHPVGDQIFDPRTGQQVTCTSCHYPMGTNFKYQLKDNGEKELCVLCHRTY